MTKSGVLMVDVGMAVATAAGGFSTMGWGFGLDSE
jgi:hypothetical protein